MNSKSIGEFLRRLRQRAGYTQSDLGAILSVTDKAISRWESGLGTPELGNLMAISKLYNVSVDDILNCNEAVFEIAAAPVAEQKPQPEPTERNHKVLSKPSQKFNAVLFFAFIIFGIYLVSGFARQAYEYGGVFPALNAVLCVVFSLAVITEAVFSVISGRIPEKASFIVKTVTCSLSIFACLVFMVMCANVTYGFYATCISVTGFASFGLFFIVRLLYTVAEYKACEKTAKALTISALAVASATVVLAVISIAVCGFVQDTDSGTYTFITVPFFISVAAAFTFTLSQITTEKVNIITFVLMVAGGAIALVFYAVATAENVLNLSLIERSELTVEIFTAFAAVAPFCSALGWFFEGSKNELVAARVTAVISALSVLPMTYYLWDMLGVNAYLGWSSFAITAWLCIVVFAAAVVGYIIKFRPALLFKGRKKK